MILYYTVIYFIALPLILQKWYYTLKVTAAATKFA